MAQNISIEFKKVPRFQAGSKDALDYLEEEGFVVFASVLDSHQTDHALDLLWDYLEELGTGIDRKNKDTWSDDRWPTAVHGGILPSYGVGHSKMQWYVRDIDDVKACFASIWDTEELLTSFDGITIWRPWTYKEEWKTNLGSDWLHIDQHPLGRPGKHCFQGVLNLTKVTEFTGGNVMVPKSHKRFERIPEEYKERLSRIHPSIDHFRFPKDDPLLSDTRPIVALMEPGDLMIWDSRTIHCSSHGIDRPPNPDDLLRVGSLICMMPKSKSNERVIEQRKEAVLNRTSTTNWSDRFINADEFPQILEIEDGDKFHWPDVPDLNEKQRKLVGW